MLILALESSTTSAKAMLFDTEQGVVQVEAKAYEAMYEDVTIHDARKVFLATAALGKKLAQGKNIQGIALSGTWHSLFLCDEKMQPVTPVYLWSNTKAAAICKEIRKDPEQVQKFYQKTGCMVNAIYPAFKLRYLQQEEGISLEGKKILGQGTYNQYCLTGIHQVTDCMASGSGLLNLHTKTWDPEILDALGIKENQLGKLISYRDYSPLTREGAELLGVSPGIPVVPACSDGGLNQVGAGALKEGIMTFSVGTSAAIRLSTQTPILPEHPGTWCYLSPEGYLSGAATSGCCNCVDWCKKRFFPPETSYAQMEAGFQKTLETPIFLPFLFGERCPGWQDERKGGFVEVRPEHTVYDFYHSVLEGTLYNVYHCYQMLTALHPVPTHVKLSGGILHSEYWTQMCADLFGCPMDVTDTEHSSLVGAAVLAGACMGAMKDPREYQAPTIRVVEPRKEKTEEYREKFQEYRKAYEAGTIQE